MATTRFRADAWVTTPYSSGEVFRLQEWLTEVGQQMFVTTPYSSGEVFRLSSAKKHSLTRMGNNPLLFG